MDEFDKMQICFTILPQARNYYRFGKFKDCKKERKSLLDCIWKGKAVDDTEEPTLVKTRSSVVVWDLL